MKYLFFFLIISFTFITCKTSRLGLGKECREYEELLTEFASKIDPRGDSCIVFRFDPDSLKYIEYKFQNGREYFYDYWVYENMYWQHKLTNDHEFLPKNEQNCLSNISKDKIIKLFGENYYYNDYYKILRYNICNKKFCWIYIQLNKEDKIKLMSICL